MHLNLLNHVRRGWIAEYRFHPIRKWRFDFAHIKMRIAVEIEGAVYTRGRHTRGTGYLKDCEKYNEAQMLGWKVLRYSTTQTGEMVRDIERLVEEQG